MPRRRSLVAMVLVLAAGCAGQAGDRTASAGSATATSPAPPPTEATTTTTTAPLPADLQDLMTTSTMTDRARRTFMAASPAVEDATTFARNCGLDNVPDVAGQARTHTQGCYVAGRIHLLQPDRAEAHDLLYVVAAHELLHAVYASLLPADRSRIDMEVEAARAGNTRLEERLRPYGATPTLDNELHSILGSEFADLSPILETHYAQFFSNRSALVAARQRTLGAREDEMRQLKAGIDDLDGRINALRDTQEALRAAGDIRIYNANVPVINGLIGRYNTMVDTLNARVDEYNALLGA